MWLDDLQHCLDEHIAQLMGSGAKNLLGELLELQPDALNRSRDDARAPHLVLTEQDHHSLPIDTARYPLRSTPALHS